MNRRRFTQLSALSLASVPLRGLAQAPAPAATATGKRRIGFAPVGLGVIADIFMKAIGQTPNAQLTGLVTGHPEPKGARFSAQYNIPQNAIYTYDTFDRIRDNAAIDAVYIALPNSLHCEYTVRAAEAGKHVLCEKPMAISSAECRRMIDACRHANVKLMIAYRIHFDPTFQKVREVVRSGALGDVQTCLGGFYATMDPKGWRLQRSLAGGGSLLDLGIYPLNTIRWMLGEEPSEYRALVGTRDKGPEYSSMEESVEWLMKFPSGILASCGSSYGQNGGNFLQINGSRGHLRIDPAFDYSGPEIQQVPGGPENASVRSIPVNHINQFAAETAHFADCILQDRVPLTPGEEGLADFVAMEAIYAAAGAPIA